MFKFIANLFLKGARSQALAKILGLVWAAAGIVKDNGIKDAGSLLAALKAAGLGWLTSLILDKWQAAKAADNETRLAIARVEMVKAGMSPSVAPALPTGALEARHYE